MFLLILEYNIPFACKVFAEDVSTSFIVTLVFVPFEFSFSIIFDSLITIYLCTVLFGMDVIVELQFLVL